MITEKTAAHPRRSKTMMLRSITMPIRPPKARPSQKHRPKSRSQKRRRPRNRNRNPRQSRPGRSGAEPVKEQPTETHRVPLSEHLAEREKRQEWERKARELEQRLQQAQPKEPAKAPEFWEQPENSIDYRVQQAVAPLQQALQQQAEMFSRTRAEDKYGADAVQAAFEDLAGRMQQGDQFARFDYQRIMSSPHPMG